MREFRITTAIGLPVVTVVITGPSGSRRVQLLFDSASFLTQVNLRTLTTLGISFHARKPDLIIKGVTGPPEEAYSVKLSHLFALGTKFREVSVGALDFSDWVKDGIDGLLGWDLIEKLHFEVDGPRKVLKVF